MSESRFLNQHIQSFASAHPSEDGWKLYEYPGDAVRRLGLPHLLDFVQREHPECLRRRIAIKEVLEEELRRIFPESLIETPSTETTASGELSSDGWYGQVDIEWVGHMLHFVSFLILTGDGYSTVHQVATRSNAPLGLLHQALESYSHSIRKQGSRKIQVLNGANIPISPVSWDDIFLPEGLLESIRGNVTSFFEGKERYAKLGIPYRRGLLLSGPPGCGKTLTIKALAHNISATFFTVHGKDGVDDSDIQRVLETAQDHSPAVVVFEDLDKLMEVKTVSLSHFLNLLDGLKVLNGVMVIATCNEPEKLDPALLHRPSRFDRVWTFPLPALEQRLALLRKHGGPYFSDGVLTEVARRTQGMSMTYVQEIVVNALLECAHEDKIPTDPDLLRSLNTIHMQRKEVSKGVESLEIQDSVGFCVSN